MYQQYIKADHIYGAALKLKAGEIELSTLAEIVTEPSTKADGRRFYAFSRSGRKNAAGFAAVHEITVDAGGRSECTCPGFVHHGHCWASDEAISQLYDARVSGRKGVFERAPQMKGN